MKQGYISKKNVYDTKIGAITYIVKHGYHTDEWKGASLYALIEKIVLSPKNTRFKKTELNASLDEIKNI